MHFYPLYPAIYIPSRSYETFTIILRVSKTWVLVLLYLESVMMFLKTSARSILLMTFFLKIKLQTAKAFVCFSSSARGIVARLEPKAKKSLQVSVLTIYFVINLMIVAQVVEGMNGHNGHCVSFSSFQCDDGLASIIFDPSYLLNVLAAVYTCAHRSASFLAQST